MALTNIEELLEKYINAETTLKEEALLRSYFTSNNVASHLQQYIPLFTYIDNCKNETFTKTIRLKSVKKNKTSRKWLSVAASITVLIGLYFIGNKVYQRQQQKKQFEKFKETLEFVSLNLNKGNEATEYLYTYEDTVHKILKQVK
ncbi:hypothetical protein [Tenacibaculum sp. UWU-22]|uniref:hypothetical protein n=1 Tax=Tenacibaculum sp. UWU-22 TaxID=3234187 RepID=UPI0034DB3D8F